jgi:hypothetical protein
MTPFLPQGNAVDGLEPHPRPIGPARVRGAVKSLPLRLPEWQAADYTCLRRTRCPGYRPDVGHGEDIELPDGLCDACERHVERALGGLPELYTQLEMIIDQHASAGEKVSGTREHPIPPRIDVLAAQAEIDALVTTWSPLVARRARVNWTYDHMRQTRGGYRVSRGARLLARLHLALIGLPYADIPVWTPAGFDTAWTKRSGLEGAMDFLAVADRGRRLVTGGSGHARLPVPCPSCEAPALIRRNGADQVDCESCGRRWPESDYRRLCLILADDYQARPAA